VRRELGVELPLRDVFEHPTIARWRAASTQAPPPTLPISFACRATNIAPRRKEPETWTLNSEW